MASQNHDDRRRGYFRAIRAIVRCSLPQSGWYFHRCRAPASSNTGKPASGPVVQCSNQIQRKKPHGLRRRQLAPAYRFRRADIGQMHCRQPASISLTGCTDAERRVEEHNIDINHHFGNGVVRSRQNRQAPCRVAAERA